MSNFDEPRFGAPPVPAPQEKGSRKTLLIVLAVLGVGIFLCCGGLGLFMYLSYSLGSTVLASQVQSMVESNPDLVDEIGKIDSIQLNLVETARQNNGDKSGSMVFDVRGSEGEGQLIVRTDPKGQEISSIVLVLPGGREIDLLDTELNVSVPSVP